MSDKKETKLKDAYGVPIRIGSIVVVDDMFGCAKRGTVINAEGGGEERPNLYQVTVKFHKGHRDDTYRRSDEIKSIFSANRIVVVTERIQMSAPYSPENPPPLQPPTQ